MSNKKEIYDTTWLLIQLSESHIRQTKDYLKHLENRHKALVAAAREGEKEDSRGL